MLDSSTELTIIDQFSELDNQSQSAFQQILDTGQYSFSKSRFQDTVPASGSILVATNPRYGNFDDFEPIGEQLNLTPPVAGGLDLVVTNIREQTATVDTPEDPLEGDLVRRYIELARSQTPELTEESLAAMDDYLEEVKSSIDTEYAGYTPSTVRLRRSLIRFTLAHARLNLADKTSSADANRVISLVEAALADLGVDPEVGEFDTDIVETGGSKEQRERRNQLLGIVEDLQDKHDEGLLITRL